MRRHLVRPGTRVRLADFDPADTGGHADEAAARTKLGRDIERLARLQDVLYADRRFAVLIVLQGMDTAGKDGTVKHVMSGVNPSGCEVIPFKPPTEEEAAHDFLWRVHRHTPRRGHITIFNRSHYEDVLVPRVHRTVLLKFFLHISKREQAARLRARLADPTKAWKFSEADVRERRLWHAYQRAYEHLLTRCGTSHAPWHVIPSDHKWYRNLAVAEAIVDALKALDLRYPRPALSVARRARLRF